MLKITSRHVLSAFHHQGNIPVKFAMAVYAIMHNQADVEEWELIDQYRIQNQPVFEWIKSILTDNATPDVDQEMRWWASQLNKGLN